MSKFMKKTGTAVADALVQPHSATRRPAAIAPHPLDPLTEVEVASAAEACKQYAATHGWTSLRFNSIALEEPAKAALLSFANEGRPAPPRRAFCTIQLPVRAAVVEATMDLKASGASVVTWNQLEGVQPMITIDDCLEAEEIVKADPAILKILRERYGLTNMEYVAADPWYYGDRFAGESSDLMSSGRILQCFMYERKGPGDNHYAHPLDLVVFLDMTARRILSTLAHDGPPRTPQHCCNYLAHLVEQERGFRGGLKPLNVVQPEGPSFEVEGNRVRWQKWDLRVGFNHREGLVLHNVGYEDGGRVRPIMHRGSIVEIIVPYGDPRSPFHKKCAFDVVDYGLGFSCSSLELGCDCLGHIKYFDAVLNDKAGDPLVVKKAVCMHEEDVGTLWKHVEYRTAHSEARRARRLVLSFIATIANYEYGFFWYFYQDGTIEHDVKLTGCLSTSPLSTDEHEGGHPTHGTLLAPGLNAQIHQHFFMARLDMAVDCPCGGQGLIVSEVNCESMPLGPNNPYGVGFNAIETPLHTELAAIRDVDPRRSRVWKVKNPKSMNPLTGTPVGWKLVPFASPPMYADASSEHARRGAFATHQLWVTPHSDDEKFPAGQYPLHVGDSDGIVTWTALDRKISDADVVIWHSFGVTHLPRIEDWPVMPVEHCGFHLKPVNFFDANPGMDIRPELNAASREHVDCVACPGRSKL